jgi:hypothetical protein
VSSESQRVAGLLLVVLPTVMVGGVSLLTLLVGEPAYMRNPLRQDLWRAGHAHAGVLLVLSLAILMPLAFFLSVLEPDATEPNGLIGLAYVGAGVLAAGVVLLGIGLLRSLRAAA